MLKNILKLSGVQTLTTKQQKETIGGGGVEFFGNPMNSTPDYGEDTTTGTTHTWKYRCYSSGTASYNTPQYFMSYTNLGYPYICHKL